MVFRQAHPTSAWGHAPMKKHGLLALILLFASFAFSQRGDISARPPSEVLTLREGWALQSLYKVDAPGGVVSTPGFQPKGWYSATVPTTVVAALVKNKVYSDPYF